MDVLIFLGIITAIYTSFYVLILFWIVKGAAERYHSNGNGLIDEPNVNDFTGQLITVDDVYQKGQEDLIKKIKDDVAKLEEKATTQDIMFDILHLLKSIEPIENEN